MFVRCPACAGTGRAPCPQCRGERAEEPCAFCTDGTEDCLRCEGTGGYAVEDDPDEGEEDDW